MPKKCQFAGSLAHVVSDLGSVPPLGKFSAALESWEKIKTFGQLPDDPQKASDTFADWYNDDVTEQVVNLAEMVGTLGEAKNVHIDSARAHLQELVNVSEQTIGKCLQLCQTAGVLHAFLNGEGKSVDDITSAYRNGEFFLFRDAIARHLDAHRKDDAIHRELCERLELMRDSIN